MFKFIYLFLFLLSAFIICIPIKAAERSKQLSSENYILILSSFEYTHPHATAIAKRIQRLLEEKNPALIFRTVYASLDIQQTMLASRLNMQKAFSQARLTPQVLIPRILVLIGDESWMLYRIMNLRGKWEKIPVVLCDVHNNIYKDYSDFFSKPSFADSLMFPLAQSTGQLPVTGVLRDNVSYNTSHFIQKIFPDIKEIIYISNGNYNDEYTWQEQQKTLTKQCRQVKLIYFNTQKVSPDSICNYTQQLSPDSAVILFNTSPTFLPLLNLPFITLQDEGEVNNSATGGYYTTIEQYAQQTVQLIMRIYNGIPVSELPFQYVQNHRFYLNAQAPHRTQASWHTQDLPGLIYYNVPPPFLVRHLRLIALILLITSLIGISCLIYYRSRKYQRHIHSLLKKFKALHETFRIVYDHMPISLVIFDQEGKLLHRNPSVQKLIEEQKWPHISPQTFYNIFTHPKIREKVQQHQDINQILPIQDGAYRQRPSDTFEDDCEYFRLAIRYIPDENQNTDNILLILINNTEIYREKIANKRIRSVFNFAMKQASIGVAEYNLYTKTGIATDSWRKHLNISNQLIRASVLVYQHVATEDKNAILTFLQQASEGKSDFFSKEISVHHANGTTHYLREQIKVMEYRPENGQIWVTELNQNIDQEKQFTEEMQMAIRKAQEAERLKNTFIANMSHEIRSPLNAIVGFSNLIISNTDIGIRSEIIHHIEESNETLLRLINDIIDLSKIETSSMSFAFSETDVNVLINDIITIYQLKAHQKKLNLECDCPEEELHILTDKIRIKQVISNFVSNAIKFTPGGSIKLGYRLENRKLYVYVTDTGIGITQENIEKIFNRYFRANKKYQGYGLGLSISRAVIEGLNGEIGVESEEGKGSTFWFRLPVKIIEVPAKQTKLSLNAPSPLFSKDHRPHILVVEDDESNFFLLHFILKDSYRLSHAWNGEEAVRMYQEMHHDLILMDIKMPKKNGYQTTQEIRLQSPDVPIIATTAYAFSKDETLALKNGFNAYITKPLQRQLLLDTISYWLNYEN